jgi:hypothetical protein
VPSLAGALGLVTASDLHAQTRFEVPQNVELKTKDDYARYEAAVIRAAQWLEETDLDQQAGERQRVDAFVIKWISGSPTVKVYLSKRLSKIYGKNIELLPIYLASYARNFLQNKTTATTFSATKAGLLSMMQVYKKGVDVSKSKEMEKLIRLAGKGGLDGYIRDNFKEER